MKAKSCCHRGVRPAFTLIEIITVIAIIMALAAMTIGGLDYVSRKAAVSRTTVFVASVGQALEQYKADTGAYPEGEGIADSTELVYVALSGDGIGPDGILDTDDDEAPDGIPDEAATVYLNTLDPGNKGKSLNVRESTNGYVLVDAWKSQTDSKVYQELFYRHAPDGKDPDMMNPPSDFDLWSLGPDGLGGPTSTDDSESADDITNW